MHPRAEVWQYRACSCTALCTFRVTVNPQAWSQGTSSKGSNVGAATFGRRFLSWQPSRKTHGTVCVCVCVCVCARARASMRCMRLFLPCTNRKKPPSHAAPRWGAQRRTVVQGHVVHIYMHILPRASTTCYKYWLASRRAPRTARKWKAHHIPQGNGRSISTHASCTSPTKLPIHLDTHRHTHTYLGTGHVN